MAETKRKQGQQRRGKERTRQGPKASEPFEQLDETARAEDSSDDRSDARTAAKRTLATAAAGALAAGLAGAAKAALERRGKGSQSEPSESEQPDQSEEADGDGAPEAADPQAEAVEETDDAEAADEPIARERASAGDSGDGDGDGGGDGDGEADEPESREPDREQGEQEDRNERPQQPQQQQQQQQRRQQRQRPQRGAEAKDAAAVVEEARNQVESLLGLEVESVSGLERSDGQWSVTLEAVGLRRVPDTTDVLTSYEVVLDDDRKLVSVAQTRRYLRSQVEEA